MSRGTRAFNNAHECKKIYTNYTYVLCKKLRDERPSPVGGWSRTERSVIRRSTPTETNRVFPKLTEDARGDPAERDSTIHYLDHV